MTTHDPSTALTSQEQDAIMFQQLENYAWDSDFEFQSGLKTILGSNPSSAQSEHLTLRARCFYFTRKNNAAVDFSAYQTWRSQHSYPRPNGVSDTYSTLNSPSTTNGSRVFDSASHCTIEASSGKTEATAPYPISFSQIVELITTGDPLPGIKKVSDTVMEGLASRPTTAKRKKPWEKGDASAGKDTVEATNSVVNVA